MCASFVFKEPPLSAPNGLLPNLAGKMSNTIECLLYGCAAGSFLLREAPPPEATNFPNQFKELFHKLE